MLYKDSEQILKDKERLARVYENKNSYFVRSGIVLAYVKALPKDARILELGCSGGATLKSLYDNGYKNLDFTDIDNYLAHEEIKALGKFKPVDLNKDSLPYPENSFDICLAIAIFEHLENPWLLKREIKKVLKKGGELFLAIPHNFNISDRLKFLFSGNLSGYRMDNDHITLQTKDVFKKCWLSDFKIKKTLYSPGFIKILGIKIKMPNNNFMNKLFGTKALHILEKL